MRPCKPKPFSPFHSWKVFLPLTLFKTDVLFSGSTCKRVQSKFGSVISQRLRFASTAGLVKNDPVTMTKSTDSRKIKENWRKNMKWNEIKKKKKTETKIKGKLTSNHVVVTYAHWHTTIQYILPNNKSTSNKSKTSRNSKQRDKNGPTCTSRRLSVELNFH